MKHTSRLAIVFLLGAILVLGAGCATNVFPGGPTVAGIIYTEITAPAQNLAIATDSAVSADKKGEASTMAFLGLFAFGDGGLDAAMKDGNITRVHHADHTVQHFLYAIFARNKIIVYGE